jgi:prepilin-type N-terminal cleavage/methylation domain-containing protein
MRRNRGFSLIELLIVVAIILIIAAMAVPSYLHSKIAANESSAVASIRSINTAQIAYNSAYPTAGFASSLSLLSGTTCTPPSSTGACLIDNLLATGTKSGYTFTLANVGSAPAATYTLTAAPTLINNSGDHYFCSFQDAVVRVSSSAISTCDPTVSAIN